jgi:hypothetical protein
VRVLLSILIVANLALFGYGFLAERQGRTAERLGLPDQLNADRIRIVRGEPEPEPPPAPAPAEACMEWAPFSQEEVVRAREALASLTLGDRLSTAPVNAVANWWVYVPPLPNRLQADREVARLAAAGVRDTYVVQDNSDMRFAVSLGIFRSEEAAQRFLDGLKTRRVTQAVVGQRPHPLRLNALYVREPVEAETKRLAELKAGWPGTEQRAAACPSP